MRERAGVGAIELRVLVHRAREKALAQRAIGNEADARVPRGSGSRPTRVIGKRFYVYAARKKGIGISDNPGVPRWSRDLSMPLEAPSPWMLKLAKLLILDELPTGVIVGSAVIEKVTLGENLYEWHLNGVARVKRPRKPKRHPQPAWFRPF